RRSGLFLALFVVTILIVEGDIDFLAGLAVYAWIIGCIANGVYILFESKGRRPADYMAHTQVVREKDYQEGNFKVVPMAAKKAEQMDTKLTQHEAEGQNLAL
ncbi:MAG: hypothetical protein AB8B69_01415, partial [Chitinophagales bacterium]